MSKKFAVNATKTTVRHVLSLVPAFAALALFTALTFTSCENFLNGADFKKQLEDEIAYTKA